MKHILLLLFISFNTLLFAQSTATDLLAKIEAADIDFDNELVLKLCAKLLVLELSDSNDVEGLNYQAMNAYYLPDYELSEASYMELLPKIEALYGKGSEDYISTLCNYGMLLRDMNKGAKAEDCYTKALTLSEENDLYKKYIETALEYGTHYELLGAMEYAIRYYKKGLKYIKKAGVEKSLLHIMTLHNLARVSEIQHRYDEAESLYKEAYAMALDTLAPEDENRMYLANNFGMLYFFTRQYKKAIPFFEQIQQSINDGLFPIETSTSMISNLADCYAHLGRYDEAEALYLRMEKLELDLYGESYVGYPVTISRMGDLYYFQGRFEEAKKMHLRAVDLAEKYFPPQDLYLFYNMEQAYLLFENIKDWEQAGNIAIRCFEKNCMDEIPATGVLKNIVNLAENQTFATMPYALKSLNVASNSYWQSYLSSKDINDLKSAYNLQLAARVLLHRLKNSFSTEVDKLELFATTHRISELGIKISQKLFEKTGEAKYQESSFVFMENNKYVLLQDALQVREAQVFGDVPVEIIEQETELDQALLMVKTKKIQAYDKESKQSAIEAYNKVLQGITDFKSTLESDYPAYYKYKYATENASIASIQAKLNQDAALIEYFIGDEEIHLIVMQKEKADYLTIDVSKAQLKEKVEALREELTNYGRLSTNANAAKQAYQDLAYWFYQKLLAPALEKTPGVKELIIVPDGLLGHLPFEAFLMSEPDGNTELSELNFLLQKYKVSYAYSANLLLHNSSGKKQTSQGVLAMGATYDIGKKSNFKFPKSRDSKARSLRRTLKSLPAVISEVEALESIFKGAYYYGKEANEKTFKEEASNYAILHLAMHGLLNEKHPILSSLAFTENGEEKEDNFLQAFEISQMQLNSRLVVLSACETGYGKFQQGEGVMSLARSFMYAGVPAMVVSMWQVNDASTSIIMQAFYQNLSQGMDKAEALRQAKLNYINLAQGIAAHPAFWAPFIQLGDSEPIELGTGGAMKYWWVIALGALGLIVVVVLRKREIV
jgi:pentatricopeptide repeat protein